MPVEHVMAVHKGAAALVGMQHIQQLVALLLSAEGAKGRAFSNLELHQVHGCLSINDGVMLALLNDPFQVPLSQNPQCRLERRTLQVN